MIHQTIPVTVPGSGSTAQLTTYFQDYSTDLLASAKRPVVLICPGGAYHFCSDREAEPIAISMLHMGYHAAVLRYSVSPVTYPQALLQVAGAVLWLRAHAEEYHLDREKIALCGFSAGGHLAASYGVFWHEPFVAEAWGASQADLRPSGLVLAYPVITSGEYAHHESIHNLLGAQYDALKEKMSLEKQVSAFTPPTFIWSTTADGLVPVRNSLLFYEALLEKDIPAELHIYEKGEHGLSLATPLTAGGGTGTQAECSSWISLAAAWLNNLFC